MPTTTIVYADILNYLTAIANKANNPISSDRTAIGGRA